MFDFCWTIRDSMQSGSFEVGTASCEMCLRLLNDLCRKQGCGLFKKIKFLTVAT